MSNDYRMGDNKVFIIDLTHSDHENESHDFTSGRKKIKRSCNPEVCVQLQHDSRKRKNENEGSKFRSKRERKSKQLDFTAEEKTCTEIKEQNTCIKLGDCSICMDDLGTKALASTKCGHVFCQECLKMSLKKEKRCPTCRCVLKGKTAYHPLYL